MHDFLGFLTLTKSVQLPFTVVSAESLLEFVFISFTPLETVICKKAQAQSDWEEIVCKQQFLIFLISLGLDFGCAILIHE